MRKYSHSLQLFQGVIYYILQLMWMAALYDIAAFRFFPMHRISVLTILWYPLILLTVLRFLNFMGLGNNLQSQFFPLYCVLLKMSQSQVAWFWNRTGLVGQLLWFHILSFCGTYQMPRQLGQGHFVICSLSFASGKTLLSK